MKLEIRGETAQLSVSLQGKSLTDKQVVVTAAEFDALYAAVLAADLPRLLSTLRGPRVHDYDGPGFELTWAGQRLHVVESGFRYEDARFDALAARFEAWVEARS